MTEEGSDTITLTGSTKVVSHKGGFTISDEKGQKGQRERATRKGRKGNEEGLEEQYTLETDDKEDKEDMRDNWHRAIERNVEAIKHGGWLHFQHFIEWAGTHEGAFMYHLFRLARSSDVVTHRSAKN